MYRVTLVVSELEDSLLADVRQYLGAFANLTDPDMEGIWINDPSRLLLEDHDMVADVRKVGGEGRGGGGRWGGEGRGRGGWVGEVRAACLLRAWQPC